jgi:ATP-dependent helicase/nuclease subunit A
LGEELRLLYVAMTRARDTLILSGAVTENKWQRLWTKPSAITMQALVAAKCCADWLGLWFAHNQVQRVHSPQSTVHSALAGELAYLRWRIVGDDEPAIRRGEALDEPEVRSRLSKAPDKQTKQKLRMALTWEYGFSAATKQVAKSSVTALRRQATDELDNEAEQIFPERRFARPARRGASARTPISELRTPNFSAAETGVAHHKFLQFLALENANDVAALKSEAARLKREKVLSADECAALDLEAIAAFWQSDPGGRIRANAASVRRELAFTAKFSPQELAEIVGTKPGARLVNEFVVVQGVADLAVLLPEEIWLVDFKTDEVRAGELPAKAGIYAPQLKLYARALAKIYTRPVSACWLYFLSQKRSVFVG